MRVRKRENSEIVSIFHSNSNLELVKKKSEPTFKDRSLFKLKEKSKVNLKEIKKGDECKKRRKDFRYSRKATIKPRMPRITDF